MNQLMFRIKRIWIYLAVGLGILLLLTWPFFKAGFPVTDDGDWMAIRLSAFYQSLIQGQFPVRLLGRLYNNYGYPAANFLYPGFLYAGSILQFLGFGSYVSIEILTVLFLAFGFFGAFIWLSRYCDSHSAFFGSLIYITSPYLLFDIYTRGSIGEVMALSLAPYLFWAISGSRLGILPWIIFLLILSHNSMMLLILFIAVIYILYFRRWNLILPFILGILSASFFWIPALYEQKYIAFNHVTVSDPSNYFIGFKKYLLVSIIQCVSFSASYFIGKHKQDKKYIIFFLAVSLLALFMSSWLSYPLWQFSWAKLFQFPYRFMGLFMISSAFLGSYIFSKTDIKGKIFFMLLLIVGFYLSSWKIIIRSQSVYMPESYYSTNEASTTVRDEYLPKWVYNRTQKRAEIPLEVLYGDGDILELTSFQDRIKATVSMDSTGVIQINKIYYPGWGVTVNGIAVNIIYDNPYGLIRFSVPQGEINIFAEFRETGLRFIADIMTVIGFLCSGFFSIQYIRGNRKK